MRDVQFTYDTEDKGISGTFTRLIPELQDWGLDPNNRTYQTMYWGWFRQVQVTLRAEAKRHRVGNKSNAPKTAAEVARIMANCKLPVYDAPSETLTEEQKIDKLAKNMTPAQIARFLAAAGITVHTS
jgi:hypothetical protein